jgi:hypothetical protein
MNIQHPTLNFERRTIKRQDVFLEVERWTFDPPETDKCLLASGELDVHLLVLITINIEPSA